MAESFAITTRRAQAICIITLKTEKTLQKMPGRIFFFQAFLIEKN
jgi:hypothetical protein